MRVSNLKMDGLQEMFLTGHNAILVHTTNAFYFHTSSAHVMSILFLYVDALLSPDNPQRKWDVAHTYFKLKHEDVSRRSRTEFNWCEDLSHPLLFLTKQ